MRITETLAKGGAALTGWAPDALMVSGAGAVAYGASLMYEPAGFLVGGLFLIAAGWLAARGGR